ncbi:MAG: hypothetical protein OXC61_04950, partial [Flavobacteriaceae bacterium]|nr:hypothetical protein [Flavobacteriaceae bacterium]
MIASGCKNYDDRFDDLNGQIATLTTQVQALQGVATQVSALNTEIGNIRSSIQGDIQTAVAGVSTTLGTNLESAQTALNGEIAKLQTALTQAAANNLTQADIDQLKSDLQTTLAAAQKTALDTALASLQAKLTELETALATAFRGALSQADLDQLKEEIEKEIAQVKEDLEESLGEGGFHSGPVIITSSGAWEATKRQLASKTEFSGDFTIDTETLSDSEVDELIAWVANITLIYGDLTITHTGKEKVIKFAKLSSVTDLDDSQLHAHYPELTSAGVITLDGEIETVKLPQLKTVKHFDGDRDDDEENIADEHHLQLKKATELILTALASYKADLTIDLGGAEATLDLSALKILDNNGDKKDGEEDLTIIGPDEVSLPELITLAKLHVQDVRSVSAPKVKGADLQIGEDVISVNVGTEGDNHINALDVTGADDLETLQIGGNPAAANQGGTVVALNADTTPDLERAHIHGGFSVVVNGLDDVEEIITGRTITKEVSLIGTGVEGDLVLDHVSGANGILKIENNDDVKTLTADKVNKLRTLSIQGNEDLETISFKALKEAGTQVFPEKGKAWHTGDTVVIGSTTYGTLAGGFGFNAANGNNLVAEQFFHEVPKAGNVDKQDGEIVDTSGISDLEAFFKSAKRVVVAYDGAEEYSGPGVNRKADDFEPQEDVVNDGNNLLLIGKGLAGTKTDAGQAKRVFLVTAGAFNSSAPETLTIGIRGGISKAINFTPGGSVKNWVNDLNDDEVKDFFKVNEITIESRYGARPSGELKLATGGTINHTQGDDDLSNDLGGSFKITIGDYSHEVILSDGSETDKPFSATNKKAVTYVDADDSSEFTNPLELLTKLDDPFTQYSSLFGDLKALDSNGKPLVPIGMNNITNRTVVYGMFDRQPIDEPVKVTWENKLDQDGLFTIIDESKKDVTTDEAYLLIILTSDVAGAGDKSTIGQPPTGTGFNEITLPQPATDAGEAYVDAGSIIIREFTIGKNVVPRSRLPQAGSD